MRNLIKILLEDDWTQIWNKSGAWTNNEQIIDYCHYIIEFSKKRNKYRLRTVGFNTKNHEYYKIALDKLTELNLI